MNVEPWHILEDHCVFCGQPDSPIICKDCYFGMARAGSKRE